MASVVKEALALFAQVCDLPADEQTAYLDLHCPNPAVRTEVQRLLAQDQETDGFLDATKAMGELAAVAIETEQGAHVPARLGPYRIVRQIGAGGMGIIYEAEQESPRRRVALKVIRPGMSHPSLLSRFQREVQLLGQLQHPGIANIYEAGLADGEAGRQPYFAMEFVDGRPLDIHADEQNLQIQDKLELLARVADAVHHAHQKGIIHRDLKPANVMVPLPGATHDHAQAHDDAIGQPKVLDFGIARMTDSDAPGATMQTEAGQMIGTLAYMSPEQVEGNSTELDTRCDVYALGVMLYELLAGKQPFSLEAASILEAARVIREDEPTQLGHLQPVLRGDVETIVAKAMDKDRERRYGSAAELAADIRRHLAQEPIEARPATTFYVISRFARRNRGFVALLAGTFMMLIVALFALGFGLLQAEARRASAVAANDRLSSVVAYQSAMLENVDVAAMGEQIVGRLRSEVQSKLSSDDPTVKRQRESFDQVLSIVNPTTVANHALDQSLMTPAVVALDREFADQPELQATLRGSLASIYQRVGLTTAALAQATKTLTTLIDTNAGPDEILRVRRQICRLHLELGNFDTAEQEIRGVLQDQIELLGTDDLETLITRRLLGSILLQQTKPEEAEVEIRKAVDRLTATVGALHEETLKTRQLLGQFFRKQRNTTEAKAVLDPLLADLERERDADDPMLLGVLLDMANLHFGLAEYDRSIEYLQRVCDARLALFGADHPDTMRANRELINSLSEARRYEEAEPILTDTLHRQRIKLGPDHPSTVSTLGAALRLMIKLERWAEAESYGLEAHAISQRTLGDDNARTVTALTDAYLVYHKSGRFDLAEQWGERMLTANKRVHGADDRRTVVAQQFVGKTLMAAGKLERAERVLADALATCERVHADSSALAGTLGQIVTTRIALGAGKQAEADARQLLAWCESKGAGPSLIAKCEVWVARSLIAQGEFADAEEWLTRALDRIDASERAWFVPIARVLHQVVAMKLRDEDRSEEIKQHYEAVLASRLPFYPEDHNTILPEVQRLMRSVGVAPPASP